MSVDVWDGTELDNIEKIGKIDIMTAPMLSFAMIKIGSEIVMVDINEIKMALNVINI